MEARGHWSQSNIRLWHSNTLIPGCSSIGVIPKYSSMASKTSRNPTSAMVRDEPTKYPESDFSRIWNNLQNVRAFINSWMPGVKSDLVEKGQVFRHQKFFTFLQSCLFRHKSNSNKSNEEVTGSFIIYVTPTGDLKILNEWKYFIQWWGNRELVANFTWHTSSFN